MAIGAIGAGDLAVRREAVRDLVIRRFVHSSRPGLSILPYLFENGFSLDEINAMRFKASPLHLAASQGFVEDLRRLLQEGADVKEEGYDHITPLLLAAYKGRIKAARILLHRRAPIPNFASFIKGTRRTLHDTLCKAEEAIQLERRAVLIHAWKALQSTDHPFGKMPLAILKAITKEIQENKLPPLSESESEEEEEFDGGCFD